MNYQEQIEKIIKTHNLAPDANIADFVDNLVREVTYDKQKSHLAEMTINIVREILHHWPTPQDIQEPDTE